MKPVRSVKNQYLGVNAHLHSYWQANGGWSDFHSAHIADLSKTLKAQLLPLGYTTEIEPSLQIRRVDDTTDWPESDVTIYDLLPPRSRQPVQHAMTDPVAVVVPMSVMLEENPVSSKFYRAVAVYEYVARKRDRGKPVVRIELLSPSNKGISDDAVTYRQKRRSILESGIVFVEIDYLHETSSTFYHLPTYIMRNGNGHNGNTSQTQAHPYRIVILDPRPEFHTGKAYLVEFDADAPIPAVTIPLSGSDNVKFDFGEPYRKTFEEELYGLEFVDYGELPERFKRYRPDDQERIARRMVAILEAVQNGVALENGPFSVKEEALEDALAQIEQLKEQLL